MDTRTKTAVKTISWRVIATVITSVVGWLVTKKWEYGVVIGLADSFIKMFAFYFHERFWLRFHIPGVTGLLKKNKGAYKSSNSQA